MTESASDRVRAALDLADLAERMHRQRLRRRCPQLSEEDIEKRVAAWYAKRPGAEHGDSVGAPRSWPPR